MKALPLPGSLLTEISPPWRRAIDREIAADNARARELGLSYDTDSGGDSDQA